MPDQLSTREQCAWRFAHGLTAERDIEQSLYDEAANLFGTHGISDMLHLIGNYQTVCGMLNTFDIPAPEGTRRPTREPWQTVGCPVQGDTEWFAKTRPLCESRRKPPENIALGEDTWADATATTAGMP